MKLTILNVACSLAPAGPDTAGGAEQIMTALDRVKAEHRSRVLAPQGPPTRGTLIAFSSGTLTGIVEHGRSGFLVKDDSEMAEAIGRADSLNADERRQAARERFSRHRTYSEHTTAFQSYSHAASVS